MPFLSVAALRKSYPTPNGPVEVLRDVNLEIEAGQMVAVIGASGVGKSTLLHVLGGLDSLDGGQVEVDGVGLHALDDAARVAFRNQRVGFVFQFHHLLPEFSALENVEMPLRIGRVPLADGRQRAQALLERPGIRRGTRGAVRAANETFTGGRCCAPGPIGGDGADAARRRGPCRGLGGP